MLISLPIVGEVLEPKHFKEVPIQVLVFISAATAIGKVGSETGMNAYIAPLDINPMVVVFWSYTVIGSHYILPFHHMNVLVGQGEGNGLYSQRETIKLGIPMIAIVYFTTVVVETLWWKLLGIL